MSIELKPNGVARTVYPDAPCLNFEDWYNNHIHMKKLVIPAMCVFSTFNMVATAQEIRVERIDAFTEKVVRSTKWYDVGIGENGDGLLMAAGWMINGQSVLEMWSEEDLGCAGAFGNYVMFKFADGTTYKIDKDDAPIDCGDHPSSYFFANKFPDKVITHIRLKQGDGLKTFVVTDATYTIQQLLDVVK